MLGTPKICFFSPFYPPAEGGVANSAHRISTLLSKDFEVHIVTIKFSNDIELLDTNIVIEQINERLIIHTIKLSSFNNIDNSGIGIPQENQPAYYGQELYNSLKKIISKQYFNFIHIFFIDSWSFPLALIACEEKIPYIASIRGNDVGKHVFDNFARPPLEFILRNATFVTSVATDLLKTARAISNINKNSQVVLNSIDRNQFLSKSIKKFTILDKRSSLEVLKLRIKNKLLNKSSPPLVIIGTVGIIKFKKGIEYLLKAFWLLPIETKERSRLIIVGKFYSKVDEILFAKWIRTYNISRYVDHIIPSKDYHIVDYYKSFDIYAHSSLYAEGCPNTLLEAMAIPLPIIATDAGASKELLLDAGIIVPATESKDMSNALKSLIDSQEQRNELSKKSLTRVIECSHDAEYAEWRKVYDSIKT